MTAKPKQKADWTTIYNYWLDLKVPEIERIPFNIDDHYDTSPWYSKKAAFQQELTNPTQGTGRHLLINFLEHEIATAFKIHASLFQLHLPLSSHNTWFNKAIEECFNKYDMSYQLWDSHAKNVVPYTSTAPYKEIEKSMKHDKLAMAKYFSNATNWVSVIDAIATEWTDISNEWNLILIPKLMDRSSAEFQEYSDYVRKSTEQRERQEYLRLKEKFGSNPSQ